MSESVDCRYQELEERIGYFFKNRELLVKALTHSSFAYERRDTGAVHEDNERLEFLGDGLLDFVVGEFLFRRVTDRDEGYLSKTRALVVCEGTLAEASADIALGPLLRFGRGEELTGGRQKFSNLANAMEALFAAVFLDGGFDAARAVILDVLSTYAEQALRGELVFDYKSKVLELAQTKGQTCKVQFVIVEESGPVHERVYTAEILADGAAVARGTGQSKKMAEQAAAKAAYPFFRKKNRI